MRKNLQKRQWTGSSLKKMFFISQYVADIKDDEVVVTVLVDEFMYVLSTRHTLEDNDRDQGQPAIYVYEVNTRRCSLSLIEVTSLM